MEEYPPKPHIKKNKWLGLLLKIVVTIVCLWYVTTKIDLKQLFETLLNVKWLLFIVSIILYIISKIFASIRLNIYFRNINIHIPQVANFKLYWLGLFYNLFLPGSISGDAYKVIRLTNNLVSHIKRQRLLYYWIASRGY